MVSEDSKGAGVNDVPVARQSRAPARPQAGSPSTGTKKAEELQSLLCFFVHWNKGLEPEGSLQGAGDALQPEVACAAAQVESRSKK